MLNFFVGIIVLQVGTAGLCYVFVEWGFTDIRLLLALSFLDMLFVGLIVLWFSSVARQCNFAEMESIRETHAKEREKLRVDAERQKNRFADKKHKEVLRATKTAFAVANIKVGSAFAGMLVLGGIMIYSQLVTFGLLMLTASAGGLAGYMARVKQDVLFPRKNHALQRLPIDYGEKKQNK